MKVDLSKFNIKYELMRQVSEELVIETYGNWQTLFVRCEQYLPLAGRWIPVLYRIGIRRKPENEDVMDSEVTEFNSSQEGIPNLEKVVAVLK